MRDRFGIVSNCWRVQLDEGASIESLIERGLQLGMRHFELRQGALGDCETEDRFPISDRLGRLASRFPEATFDLAVEMPVVTGAAPIDVNFEARCLAAAVALASPAYEPRPHLRIVDLAGSAVATGADRARSLDALSLLDEKLRGASELSILSLEHSIQPWPQFRELFDEARSAIDLKLCFDPCNLWLFDGGPPVSEIVASIEPEQISMLHVKQRGEDSPGVWPGLEPGALPWPEPIHQLETAGYVGPILFETAPCADVFKQTDANCRQLEEWLRQI
ncbi:MAG: TIM barrel protein [Planctomycetota bacterium]|nr:TIM barrel protein [Planctomycetota bacterium]MDA1250721.1 TIM barrel protein [Planctomycetota bacterium]